MAEKFDQDLSVKYCKRFGDIALSRGFITAEQLKEALEEQQNEDRSEKTHRLIGRILFDKGLMTPGQIEEVLNDLFKETDTS